MPRHRKGNAVGFHMGHQKRLKHRRQRWFVYIGRFQPFHNGHLTTLSWALGRADGVVVVIGSDNIVPSLKNPWTATQRASWITEAVNPSYHSRLRFVGVRDYPNEDNLWRADIRAKVHEVTPPGAQILVTGYRKDSSTYYLTTFEEWDSEFLEAAEAMSATTIREAYFRGAHRGKWAENLPAPVAEGLAQFKRTQLFLRFAADFKGGTR
jgi:bifunctional NMN adenylyltransferase/nudix hydrolase